jgi:hypothetical protein
MVKIMKVRTHSKYGFDIVIELTFKFCILEIDYL